MSNAEEYRQLVGEPIEAIVDEVISLPEIHEGLERSPDFIQATSLRRRLIERAEQIIDQAASAIAAEEAAATDLRTRLTRVAEASSDAPAWAMAVTTLAGIIGLIGLFVRGDSLRWLWDFFWTTLSTDARTFIAAATVVVVSSLIRLFRSRSRARESARREKFGVDDAELRLATATADRKSAVRVAAVQNATLILNDMTKRGFEDRLFVGSMTSSNANVRITSGTGLAEVVDRQHEIATNEGRRVIAMIRSLPGASIGVAGPRGAGKSTLLWSICGTNPTTIGDELAITVATSAPVQYEARDFLLHIYSSVCRAVLTAENEPEERGEIATARFLRRPDRTRLLRFALPLAVLLISVGVTLVAAGPVMAMLWPLSKSAARLGSPAVFLQGTPLSPWGWAAIVVGLFIFAYCFFVLVRRPRDVAAKKANPTEEHARARLVAICRRTLQQIRFQQSFTSGWSGALKVIPGLDAGLTGAMTLAQQQQTLPEIVGGFVSLLRAITTSKRYSRVIIAIDELDKLRSDEDAERFLNEIKAIFNVPKCYYLISVSESAISAFERRGLPFRDAFDSSFDDVVHVDYLTLDESRHLLSRRILNCPDTFLCLAHVLSAGLPRDLIRAARAILDCAAENPSRNRLPQVCATLALREIRKKLRATAIAARTIALEPERSAFLTWASALRDLDVPSAAFMKHCGELRSAPRDDLRDDDRVLSRKLEDLREELDAFLAYSVTTIELFGTITNAASWQAAVETWILELAAVRQSFEVGARVARFQVDELRAATGLAVHVRALESTVNEYRSGHDRPT